KGNPVNVIALAVPIEQAAFLDPRAQTVDQHVLAALGRIHEFVAAIGAPAFPRPANPRTSWRLLTLAKISSYSANPSKACSAAPTFLRAALGTLCSTRPHNRRCRWGCFSDLATCPQQSRKGCRRDHGAMVGADSPV